MSLNSILPTPENAGILVNLSALQDMDHNNHNSGGILDGLLAAQPEPILPVDPSPQEPLLSDEAPVPDADLPETQQEEEQEKNQFAWLADFPEPLTYEQRERVRTATTFKVNRYRTFHQRKEIVQKGYDSLMTLINRLQREKEELEAKEREAASGGATPAAGTSATAKRPREEEAPPPPAPKEGDVTGTAATAAAAAGPPPPAPPSRPRSRLLGSKMFANMQSLLATATAEQQSQSQLIQQREHINRQNKLRLLEADLAKQQPTYNLLQEKLNASVKTDDGLRNDCVEALHVWEEMLEMERNYASSFFLEARGATRPVLSLSSHRELLAQEQKTERAAVAIPTITYVLKDYSIYFLPATMTPEIEDRLRCTIESGILDKYVSYRQRLDPLLAKLEEEEKQRLEDKLNTLKATVGLSLLDASSTSTAGQEGILPNLADLQQVVAGSGTATGGAGKKPSAMGISDSESDGEEEAIAHDGKEKKSAEEEEKQRIQSALSALDDFEGF